jgi:hypothetical protein
MQIIHQQKFGVIYVENGAQNILLKIPSFENLSISHLNTAHHANTDFDKIEAQKIVAAILK